MQAESEEEEEEEADHDEEEDEEDVDAIVVTAPRSGLGDEKEEGEEIEPPATFKAIRAWNIWYQSSEETLKGVFGKFGEVCVHVCTCGRSKTSTGGKRE